ncbi:uncharacterized protein si:ch211-146l10.8 isoform X1 [Danio rerio]|uniref:POU domain, class 6, transcription factor 2 isoform X1 n=1 Tax=Danio rerio TaxID=7955 RepID=A0A140LFX8_DANRE|nr:ankyrin repeat domain-containing protein 17-like [Danio rerio]|eukprot:XP_017209484.1 ankyrin repeat domain-containing protein 17-like [Danio rerio]
MGVKTMGVKTMWILSVSLAVLLALGTCDYDTATIYTYSPGSSGGNPRSENSSPFMQEVKQSLYSFYGLTDVLGPVRKDTVKWGYDAGSYRSQTGSSGTPVTSNKPDSESHATSQPGFQVGSAASGSLVYGSVRNPVNMGVSGYDSSQSTNLQVSEVISSSDLTPLQQSSYSVSKPKPVQVVSSIPLRINSMSVAKPSSQQIVQTISQSSSEQPVSSGTVSQSSPQQFSLSSGKPMSQTSLQSAVQSDRWPLKPLKGKPHHSGSWPVHNVATSFLKPLQASKPSLSISQYGSVPSSLAVASYELVSQSAQSSGQTVNQPGIIQSPSVIDLSVVQPSSPLIQQAVDTSVSQASSQQLIQAGQSVSTPNVQPVDASYVFVAQPNGLQPPKHHKGKHHFGSKPFNTSPHQTLRFTSVGQSSSQMPAQTSYQSVSQPSLQLPVQASYQPEAQSHSQQPGPTRYQLVAKPNVQEPPKISFSAAPLALQKPAQTSYQLVAQLGVQQPAQVSLPVAQPSHLQEAQSSYEYVAKQNGQTLFNPVQSHEIHQIGSKLYSCHELPQHSYQRRHPSPSTPSLPTLAQDFKPVVLPSDPIPMDLNPLSSLASTFKPAHLREHPVLQSVVLKNEQPVELEIQSSDLSLVKPGPVTSSFVSQPTGHPSRPLQQPGSQQPTKPLQDVFWPVVKPDKLKPSGFEAQVLPSHVSSVSGQFVSQSQILPVGLSLAQSTSSLAVPVQASQLVSQSNVQPVDRHSVFVAQPSGLTPLKHHKGKHHVGSSYQPQVLSSSGTVLQPVLQTTSVVVPSSYQSTSSQAWSNPIVSNFESVQPELPIQAQLTYQSVTDQNAPGPVEGSRHPSQKLLKLLQQVKS